MEDFRFPVFRKYCNEKSYFKVESFKLMTERQIIGRRVFEFTIRAEKFPEQLKIRDLLECSADHYCKSSEEEYNEAVKGRTISTPEE